MKIALDTTDCVFFQLAKANQVAGRFLGQRVAPFGVTPVQSLILALLNEEDGVTPRELGVRAELDSATLTGLLDRLEASGHLAREANPDDRRSVRIQLTQTGREAASTVAQALLEANAAFLKPLTVPERRTLLRCITKLRLNKDI